MATSNNGTHTRIERIIVLLDSSRAARVALDAAAELAARQHARLLGLFVENTDLLHSASLPFGREIGFTSGRIRPLSSADMERRLRHQPAEARRLLAAAGRRCAVEWSLQVCRGQVETETLAITTPTDLLVLGRIDWARDTGLRFGQLTVRIATTANCSVMVLGEAPQPVQRPILVLYEEPETGDRALAAAMLMARDTNQALTILLPPSADAREEGLEQAARIWARRHKAAVNFMRLPGADAPILVQALRQTGGRLLILSRASHAVRNPANRSLLDEIASPVVVVP
ncbi:MAG: universal stress protein [Nitrococcus mobilis]|nr:universal stress protein [Nitrococcus mobilis]